MNKNQKLNRECSICMKKIYFSNEKNLKRSLQKYIDNLYKCNSCSRKRQKRTILQIENISKGTKIGILNSGGVWNKNKSGIYSEKTIQKCRMLNWECTIL